MVRKIYTTTGDNGETSLVGGQRVSKADHRIRLYGQVDELNSFVGIASAQRKTIHKSEGHDYLFVIQNLLFNIGSNLATIPEDRLKFKLPTISTEHVKIIEEEIDRLQVGLEPLTNFILPGGGVYSASLHVCRTVTRRLEVEAIDFERDHGADIPKEILKYFNRLSDFFFVLARVANKEEGIADTIWKKDI